MPRETDDVKLREWVGVWSRIRHARESGQRVPARPIAGNAEGTADLPATPSPL